MRLIDADALILRTKSPVKHGEGTDDRIHSLDTFNLKEILELAPTVMKWVSIYERMPNINDVDIRNGFRVLVCNSDTDISNVNCCYYEDVEYHAEEGAVSHWMTLPPAAHPSMIMGIKISPRHAYTWLV